MPSEGEKDPLLESIKPVIPSPNASRQTQRPPRRPPNTRSLHLSITLAILCLFVLYAQRNNPQGAKYKTGGKALPNQYAICSKEGKRVYTVPQEGGVGAVECVVINGKEVVDTGSLAHVRRKWPPKQSQGTQSWLKKERPMKIFYLEPGHSLTPGLIDSHGHPLQYGLSRQLQLTGAASISEIVTRVEEFVCTDGKKLPPGAWVEGLGWDQNIWPVKDFPSADDLDTPLLHDLPIILYRVDVHAIWVSQAILDQLKDLPEKVEGGQIVRDPKGRPTGVFVDNAMDLVLVKKPPYSEAQLSMALDQVMKDALSKGMTTVHDAELIEDYVPYYRKWADQGRLKMRFYSMLRCTERTVYCGDTVPQIHDAQDGRFNLRAVKLFADGALGSRGAALLEDYSDTPGWNGFLLSPEGIWGPLIKAWYAGGWQVNVHAIGDRANHVVLNAMEKALAGGHAKGRLRMEHAQIMTLKDLSRAAKIGVIASFQPTHATSDMKYAEDRLGAERLKGAYAWRSYIEHGGRIALGSDFPVESIDPLKGFYAAVTRLAEDGTSPHGPGGWYPNEKLTREQALRGFTIDGADASLSNMTGSLTPGRRFDAVIWDDDLMTVDPSEILEVQVKGTFVDGQLAYGQLET